tara:strand:- start:617 stop:880 length:264 start_codon:yes stop_codon:yes gene_type:complete
MRNDKATYTLWNGSQMIATYPHTREGYDAAFARAFDLGAGAAIYSSRDDLVWSASDDEKESVTDDFAEMDAIYDESGDYDINELFYN